MSPLRLLLVVVALVPGVVSGGGDAAARVAVEREIRGTRAELALGGPDGLRIAADREGDRLILRFRGDDPPDVARLVAGADDFVAGGSPTAKGDGLVLLLRRGVEARLVQDAPGRWRLVLERMRTDDIGLRIGRDPGRVRLVFEGPGAASAGVGPAGDAIALRFNRSLARGVTPDLAALDVLEASRGSDGALLLRPASGWRTSVLRLPPDRLVVDLLREDGAAATAAAGAAAPEADTADVSRGPPSAADTAPSPADAAGGSRGGTPHAHRDRGGVPDPHPRGAAGAGEAVSGVQSEPGDGHAETAAASVLSGAETGDGAPGRTAHADSAPVRLRVLREGDAAVRFVWERPVAAAALRRGSRLFLVFDRPAEPVEAEGAQLAEVLGRRSRAFRVVKLDSGTLVTLVLTGAEPVRIEGEGGDWRLVFGAGAEPRPVDVVARADALFVPEARSVMPFVDGVAGERLLALGFDRADRAVPRPRRFVDLTLLPTLAGAVIRPQRDDLAIEPVAGGVRITRPGGLRIARAGPGEPAPRGHTAPAAHGSGREGDVLPPDAHDARGRGADHRAAGAPQAMREDAEPPGHDATSAPVALATAHSGREDGGNPPHHGDAVPVTAHASTSPAPPERSPVGHAAAETGDALREPSASDRPAGGHAAEVRPHDHVALGSDAASRSGGHGADVPHPDDGHRPPAGEPGAESGHGIEAPKEAVQRHAAAGTAAEASREERHRVGPGQPEQGAAPSREERFEPVPWTTTFGLAELAGLDPARRDELRRRARAHLADPDPNTARRARLELARLELADALGPEARTLLALLDGSAETRRRALGLAAAALAGDRAEMDSLLADPELARSPEAALYRALRAAAEGRWDEAGRDLDRAHRVLKDYPEPLQKRLGPVIATIALQTGDPDRTFVWLDRLSRMPLERPLRERLRFLEALAVARDGAEKEALAILRRLEEEADWQIALQAAFARLRIERDGGRITPKRALARLETLAPLWRGHPWEPAMLRMLGDLRAENGHVEEALAAWRELLARFTDSAEARDVPGRMRTLIRSALDPDAPPKLAPEEALRLWERHAELVTADAGTVPVLVRLAGALAEAGSGARALALLERLEPFAQEEAARQLALLRMRLLLESGRAREALGLGERLARAWSEWGDRMRQLAPLLARAALEAGEPRRVAELGPWLDPRDGTRLLFDAAMRLRDAQATIRHGRALVAQVNAAKGGLDPADAARLLQLAATLRAAGSADALRELLAAVAQRAPEGAWRARFEALRPAAELPADAAGALAAARREREAFARWREDLAARLAAPTPAEPATALPEGKEARRAPAAADTEESVAPRAQSGADAAGADGTATEGAG